MDPIKPPKHFYSLDVLRGLAALSVVFAHWHMLLSVSEPVEPAPEKMPLAVVFRPLYEQGFRAVDLFFCLSGFIFYWLYAAPIREKQVSFFKFGVLRMSRLYPLHLATLLIVALGQYLFLRSTGRYFVYEDNGVGKFAMNLLFVQNWFSDHPLSFNGPSWSISIEIAVYLAFFAICRKGLTRWWVWAGLIAVAMFLRPQEFISAGFYRCGTGFFTGCLTYLLYAQLVRLAARRWIVAGLVGLTVLLWAGAAIPFDADHPLVAFVRRFGGGFVRGRLEGDPTFASRVGAGLYFNFGVFPLTVLTLAVAETARGSLGKRLAFIGDLSYSSYLLHFPLMLAVMLMVISTGIPHAIFYSPITLAAFFALLVVVSTLCYRWFEKPAQDAIRTMILGKKKPAGSRSPRLDTLLEAPLPPA